jgi:hypothetical protein
MTSGHRSGAQTIAFRATRPDLLYSPITEIHISKKPGMDEYLFITMAKLKADRLRLEREQRAQEPAEESRNQPIETQRQPARTPWCSRALQWREQS